MGNYLNLLVMDKSRGFGKKETSSSSKEKKGFNKTRNKLSKLAGGIVAATTLGVASVPDPAYGQISLGGNPVGGAGDGIGSDGAMITVEAGTELDVVQGFSAGD